MSDTAGSHLFEAQHPNLAHTHTHTLCLCAMLASPNHPKSMGKGTACAVTHTHTEYVRQSILWGFAARLEGRGHLDSTQSEDNETVCLGFIRALERKSFCFFVSIVTLQVSTHRRS